MFTCKHCNKAITQVDERVWHGDCPVFPQYCYADMLHGSQLHEPSENEAMAGMMPQYIVRLHDRKQPWELPKYFSGAEHGAWLDGTFKHASASVLTIEEAQQVTERFPNATMLRVG